MKPYLIAALAAELQALNPQTAILTAAAPRFTPETTTPDATTPETTTPAATDAPTSGQRPDPQ